MAIANASLAYGRYVERFADERWERLRAAGASAQRPLWASTGTKDPNYRDVLYVERLIAPGVINTMPEKTLRAFADHGDPTPALGYDIEAEIEAARAVLARAAAEGVDLETITTELEREGVQAFCDSYAQILSCIDARLRSLLPAA